MYDLLWLAIGIVAWTVMTGVTTGLLIRLTSDSDSLLDWTKDHPPLILAVFIFWPIILIVVIATYAAKFIGGVKEDKS